MTEAEILELHQLAENQVYSRLLLALGRDEVDVKKWTAQKLGMFISYRESGLAMAQGVFNALGEYNALRCSRLRRA